VHARRRNNIAVIDVMITIHFAKTSYLCVENKRQGVCRTVHPFRSFTSWPVVHFTYVHTGGTVPWIIRNGDAQSTHADVSGVRTFFFLPAVRDTCTVAMSAASGFAARTGAAAHNGAGAEAENDAAAAEADNGAAAAESHNDAAAQIGATAEADNDAAAEADNDAAAQIGAGPEARIGAGAGARIGASAQHRRVRARAALAGEGTSVRPERADCVCLSPLPADDDFFYGPPSTRIGEASVVGYAGLCIRPASDLLQTVARCVAERSDPHAVQDAVEWLQCLVNRNIDLTERLRAGTGLAFVPLVLFLEMAPFVPQVGTMLRAYVCTCPLVALARLCLMARDRLLYAFDQFGAACTVRALRAALAGQYDADVQKPSAAGLGRRAKSFRRLVVANRQLRVHKTPIVQPVIAADLIDQYERQLYV
jgi:hypothetical protein